MEYTYKQIAQLYNMTVLEFNEYLKKLGLTFQQYLQKYYSNKKHIEYCNCCGVKSGQPHEPTCILKEEYQI